MLASLARIFALISAASLIAPAWSLATYSTTASSSFLLDGSFSTVLVNSHAGTKTETGTGAATFSGSSSGAGINPATISIGVSGSASAPPDSSATSTFMSGHVYFIDNTPGTRREIPFSFTYSWTTTLAAGDPSLEFASSGAFFGISGFEAGIDSIDIDGDGLGALVDPIGGSAYVFNPTYTTFGGTGSGGLMTATITGKIIVEANQDGEFSVITDTTGFAGARVPEPGTLALASIALLAALGARRRRPH